MYAKDRSYSYAQDLHEIRRLGADHVSLIIAWYQKDIRANEIYPYATPVGDFETTPDDKLREIIRQAHQEGLKVFLFPILRLEERKDKEWRGVLAPSQPAKWFDSYRNFTLHYARLASETGVQLYSVGSELCSMELHTSFWNRLIRDVRKVFKGELLYSANWDHYGKIGFWENLDYLGLNGYYELSDHEKPSLRELLRKWWDIENEISSWQEKLRKKIIFTEIGYPSIDGACGKPWDYTRETPIDLEEQALCYEAFFLTWGNSERLGGVYFWNWFGPGGANDRTYTPRGKPAEKVLVKWFQNVSPAGEPFRQAGLPKLPPT